jgi:hypothetical protein
MTVPEWAPEACTLPTAERPLRAVEFDELFAVSLSVERSEPTRLDVTLPADVEPTARNLADRESQCCSFFAFDFEPAGDGVLMHIGVPPTQVKVLDALARIAR